jgi:SPP1 gp7 family putative phage head morphogenesis protein
MLVRHGEKPEDFPGNRGVKKHGKTDEHSLTVRGWTRAGALVELFAPGHGSVRPGLATPTAIYASGGEHGDGRRTRQTVSPLAKRLGLEIYKRFARADGEEADLAREVSVQPGPTLICWQHEDLPKLANSFGQLTPAPPEEWPEDRYDVVWTLTPDDDGGWVFAQVPQLLLDGDGDEPIGIGKSVGAELTKAGPDGESGLLARLTAWFASRDAIAATQLSEDLVAQLVAAGLDHRAVTTVGEMVLDRPLTGRSRHGAPTGFEGMPATRRVAAEEPRMRAEYLLAAAQRLSEAVKKGRYDQALDSEKRYLDAHVAAGRNRRRAAVRLDELGKDGQTLVWRTVMDQHTTPECAALNGRIFSADDPPGIPGAMHSRCRCTAEAWGRGPLVNWGNRAA